MNYNLKRVLAYLIDVTIYGFLLKFGPLIFKKYLILYGILWTEFAYQMSLILGTAWLVCKYGGSAGKLILHLSIVNSSSKKLSYKASMVRVSPFILFSVIQLCVFYQIEARYGLDFMLHTDYRELLKSAHDFKSYLLGGIIVIIYIGESFILFLNSKHRALHDYLAGSYVIEKPSVK